MSRRGLLRCALAAVLFGASTPAAARLAHHLGAVTAAGLLYLGAALAVLPFAWRSGGNAASARAAFARAGPQLACAVFLGGGIAPVLLLSGLRLAPAATASLLLNLELVFTAAVAVLFFREQLGWPLIVGTALVFAASASLSWSGGHDLRWGAALIAAACLCWAIDNSVTARLDVLAPAQITLVKGVVAGTVNFAIGLVVGGRLAAWPVLGALVVGGLGYGASITLWVAGARDIGAARGQLVFSAAPFVGAVVAWTLFGQPVGRQEVLALALALSGVSLVLRSGHSHSHGHPVTEHDHEHAHLEDHHDHSHEGEKLMRHQHRHGHEDTTHEHGHLPDLHHRHRHGDR